MPLSFPTSEIASIELYYVFFVDSVKKKSFQFVSIFTNARYLSGRQHEWNQLTTDEQF